MSDNPIDGGRAFPQTTSRDDPERMGCIIHTFYPGMSLRDYFATAALQGILAACANPACQGWGTAPANAKEAYALADAMLAERYKP